MQASKLYFSRGNRSQQNKRGKRSAPVRNENSVLLHQSGSLVVASSDFTYVTVFEKIFHSQQVNPPDAAQIDDVAVAEPATAKEASVPASTSTQSVQRGQTVHSGNTPKPNLSYPIIHLFYFRY